MRRIRSVRFILGVRRLRDKDSANCPRKISEIISSRSNSLTNVFHVFYNLTSCFPCDRFRSVLLLNMHSISVVLFEPLAIFSRESWKRSANSARVSIENDRLYVIFCTFDNNSTFSKYTRNDLLWPIILCNFYFWFVISTEDENFFSVKLTFLSCWHYKCVSFT